MDEAQKELALALVMRAMVGVGATVVREYSRKRREEDAAEFKEVSALLKEEARGDFRPLTRLFPGNA